jgi:small redox-active disulfide protein 2
MVIKVLGPGCANCRRLEESVREAVSRTGIAAEVVKVDDVAEIMSYGVLSTPGLVVDEELKVSGRVPSADEIARILREAWDVPES